MPTDVISSIRKELEQQIDEKTRSRNQSFFKEPVTFYGVKISTVSKIARKYFLDIKHLGKQEIFSLCEQLLRSDYGEEAFIALRSGRMFRRSLKEPLDKPQILVKVIASIKQLVSLVEIIRICMITYCRCFQSTVTVY